VFSFKDQREPVDVKRLLEFSQVKSEFENKTNLIFKDFEAVSCTDNAVPGGTTHHVKFKILLDSLEIIYRSATILRSLNGELEILNIDNDDEAQIGNGLIEN
jgi:hypothetical protein